MASPRLKEFVVERPAQWAALRSPVRVEIVEFFRLLGPCSIADLAKRMDRPADSLYYHVRALAAQGFLTQTGWRRAGRRAEAVYDLTAPRLRVDYDPRTKRNVEPLKRLISPVLRMTARNFCAAVDDGRVDFQGGRRNAYARRHVAWLTPADVKRILRHTDAIARVLERGRGRRAGRLYSLTLFFVPLVRKHSRNGRHSAARS